MGCRFQVQISRCDQHRFSGLQCASLIPSRCDQCRRAGLQCASPVPLFPRQKTSLWVTWWWCRLQN